MPSNPGPTPASPPERPIDLGMLSVLLVEDNAVVRSLLRQTLRALGIRQIEVAAGVAAARAYLDARKAQLPSGVPAVDLVISDFVMPEADGLEFLRWLRMESGATDRFTPFILMSAAADPAVMARSRDLGANEFLAKPFTARSVSDRILATIWRPRRFVLAPRFFGPDRRRSLREVEDDRRTLPPAHISIVDSEAKGIARGADRVCYFEIPNRLLAKVGGGGRAVPAIAPELIAAAEQAIRETVERNASWIAAEVRGVGEAVERLAASGQAASEEVAGIARGAHELRGAGGIFGYPLMTVVAKSLYEVARRHQGGALSNRDLRMFQVHADALRLIVELGMRGDGGDVGQALVRSLKEMRARVG